MKGKRQRYRATTYMEILRNSFQKNAVGIDRDSGLAKKEPESGDGNDPPAMEDASARRRQLAFSFRYGSDSGDGLSYLRGRVAHAGVFRTKSCLRLKRFRRSERDGGQSVTRPRGQALSMVASPQSPLPFRLARSLQLQHAHSSQLPVSPRICMRTCLRE